MAVLLAPTVPSEPNPQNLQAVIPSGVTSIFCTSSKDDCHIQLQYVMDMDL